MKALLLLLCLGCGSGFDAARRAILASDRVCLSMTNALVVFDAERQNLIALGPDKERAARDLVDWRRRRDGAVVVIDKLRDVLLSAPVMVDLAEHGTMNRGQIDAMLISLWGLIQQSQKLLSDLGVRVDVDAAKADTD